MRIFFAVLAAAAVELLLISAAAPGAGGGRVIRFLEVDQQGNDLYIDSDHNNRGSAGDIFIGGFALRYLGR